MRRFLRDRAGAVAIEYVLIAALASMLIVTGATGIGNRVAGIFNRASVALAP